MRELAPFLHKDAKLSNARPNVRNPFLPHKNAETGHWHPAKYSLRRQADLVKSARASGTLHLLPPGPKLSLSKVATASQAAAASVSTSDGINAAMERPGMEAEGKTWWGMPVEWKGEYKEKEVKGADVGNRLYAGKKRMFKGHKWERTQQERQREQKMLMKDMKARIERFKTVSAGAVHGCFGFLPSSLAPSPRFSFTVWLCAALLLGILAARRGHLRRFSCLYAYINADTCVPLMTAQRPKSMTIGLHADTHVLFLPDIQAQDAIAYQRCPAGVLLQASILILTLHLVAYSTALSRTLPSHNPLLCSLPAWLALGHLSHASMRR